MKNKDDIFRNENIYFQELEGTRYKLESVIAKGAYGIVAVATDTYSNEKVAIKKIVNIFEDSREAKLTLREFKIMKFFKNNDENSNIIGLKDIIKPTSYEEFNSLLLVIELMEEDLDSFITRYYQQNNVKMKQYSVVEEEEEDDDDDDEGGVKEMSKSDEILFKQILFDILKGLKEMKDNDILHRDLRPKNILIKDSHAKVCDFGLARSMNTISYNRINNNKRERLINEMKKSLLTNVSNQNYIPPEGYLGTWNYNDKVDMYSFGLIMLQLYGFILPKFQTNKEQFQFYFDICGDPTNEFKKIDEDYYFNGYVVKSRVMDTILDILEKNDISIDDSNTSSYSPRLSRDQMEKKLQNLKKLTAVQIDDSGLDLLSKIFSLNPEKRISVEEALAHPFFNSINHSQLQSLQSSYNCFRRSLTQLQNKNKNNNNNEENNVTSKVSYNNDISQIAKKRTINSIFSTSRKFDYRDNHLCNRGSDYIKQLFWNELQQWEPEE